MANFQKFIKRSTKGIFLGIIGIMVVSLTISFAPGGGLGGEEDSGDAGVIFDDVTVSNKDFIDHKKRAMGHFRYQDYQKKMEFLYPLYKQFRERQGGTFTPADMVKRVARGNEAKLEGDGLKDKTWEHIILLQDAGDKGIEVSEEEAGKAQKEFIEKLGENGKKLAYQFLGVDNYTIGTFFHEVVKMEKLLTLVAQSQFPAYEDIYAEIVSGTEEGRVLYTTLNPYDTSEFFGLLSRVHPDWLAEIKRKRVKESKIREYYERKTIQAKYSVPEKIQVYYLLADLDEIQKGIGDPTGKQAKEYFDRNKKSFLKNPTGEGGGIVYKTLEEALPEVQKRWKRREAEKLSSRSMRDFQKWLKVQVAASVELEYLLVDRGVIADSLEEPSLAEKKEYYKDHPGEFVKDEKTIPFEKAEADVSEKIRLKRAEKIEDRLVNRAVDVRSRNLKKPRSKRMNFFPSLEAALEKELPEPAESAISRYYVKYREDFVDPSGDPDGDRKYLSLDAVRSDIRLRLREGGVVQGVSDDLKMDTRAFQKFVNTLGVNKEWLGGEKNWREVPPHSWTFESNRRGRDVSEIFKTSKGRVICRLKSKTYGSKLFEDYKKRAKTEFKIDLISDNTSYFDQKNMKEVVEKIGTGQARGPQSTLSTWGFDANRKKGDVSRQMRTSRGFVFFLLQGKKESFTPKTIIESVRERIVKALLKDKLKDRASELAMEISKEINLHGLARARKKYGIEFKRSRFFKLDGSDSAIQDDPELGKRISSQVMEARSGEQVSNPVLPIGESISIQGISASPDPDKRKEKDNWSFVVYMEDRLDRGVDIVKEEARFEDLRKQKTKEVREQYKTGYIERVVNRAKRKELLDSDGK